MTPRVSTPVLKTTELQTTMREGSTPPTLPSEKQNSHPDVSADGVYNVHSRPQRSLYVQDLGGMEEPKTIGFLIWALITTLTVLVFILRLLTRMNHRCCAHNSADAADQLDAWSHTTVQLGTETHTTVQPGSETHATDPEILHATLNNFKTHLSKRGYSTSEIDPIIKETVNTNRSELIIKKTKEQSLRNPTRINCNEPYKIQN
ncbi:uncharacterized protein LOC134261938 [Saccostrea cucullata]|uniref:uncharacterized protein LOC134261938 n=1 Tax=Saccostrea cuccullata TaxID=36930 RepID=UPI002ED3DDB2